LFSLQKNNNNNNQNWFLQWLDLIVNKFLWF